MTAIDLSNYAGLAAIGLLTANILLGMLIATKYNPATSWARHERRAMSRRAWKRIHFTTYALFPAYAVHSILTDPALKDRLIDPFDGEKVFVELCVLGVVAAIALRVQWQRRQPPPRVHRPRGQQ